jgi:hypothetical protein
MGTIQRPTIEVVGLLKGVIPMFLAQSVFQEGSRKVPRPLFPPFLEEHPTGAHEQQGSTDEMNS